MTRASGGSGVTFPTTLEALNERVSYRLSFTPTPEPRTWHWDMLDGPRLPNAYGRGTSPGSWEIELSEYKDLLEGVLTAVISEAIHEALEWLRLDGEILVDPHSSEHSNVVLRASTQAVDVIHEHLVNQMERQDHE